MKPRIPGPRGNLLTGHLRHFYKDQLGFLTQCAKEYGDVVRLRFLHVPVFLLSHPNDIESVFGAVDGNFLKSKSVRLPLQRLVFGKGVLSNEGNDWLTHRREVQRSLKSGAGDHAAFIATHLERFVAELERKGTADIYEDLKLLSAGIAATVVFGRDTNFQTDSLSRLIINLTDKLQSVGSPTAFVHHYLPTRTNRSVKHDVHQLERIIQQSINKRRAAGDSTAGLLSSLLYHETNGSNRQLTDREIRDEVVTLLMAGHETPAIALTWTLFLLTQHPSVESRLLSELNKVLGKRRPSVSDLERLQFTQSVLKESMRLYPPNRSVGREAQRQCEVGGYTIPAKSQLIMSQWVVHRDSRFFDHPEEFLPDRWESDTAQTLPKYAYFPFGGGQRTCLGKSIALIEMTLILATLVQKFRISLVPGSVVEPRPAILLRPHGVNINFEPRPIAAYATATNY